MIDTDNYEGYTNDYIWTWKRYASHFDHDADRALIQDAPLLLAEVKRLRKELDAAEDVIQYALDRVGNDDDAKKVFEDFLEVIE